MEENKIEALDKMFPQGYVILYPSGEKHIRCYINAPENGKFTRELTRYHAKIVEASREEES